MYNTDPQFSHYKRMLMTKWNLVIIVKKKEISSSRIVGNTYSKITQKIYLDNQMYQKQKKIWLTNVSIFGRYQYNWKNDNYPSQNVAKNSYFFFFLFFFLLISIIDPVEHQKISGSYFCAPCYDLLIAEIKKRSEIF